MMTRTGPDRVLERVRQLLLALLAAVMLGTGVDLLLLEHYEDPWQLAPLLLIGAGLLVVAAVAVRGGRTAVVALQCTMVLFIGGGLLGVALHCLGTREFQREIDPSLAGWALFVKVVTAKAPPALAPSVMIQMGLLGLLYTFGHPALRPTRAAHDMDRSDA